MSCLTAAAQASPEVKAFQDAAGRGSVLFRGKQATAHDRPANGNPYWSSPTFVPGEIVFEDNLYDDIQVNIDAATGEALVRKSDSPIAIALPPTTVSLIRTADATYEGIGPDDPSLLPEGFYEVLGDGTEKVYKHVVKKLQTTTQEMNGDPIGYYDPNYRRDLNNYYGIQRIYYFKDADGVFTRIRGKRALLRKFPAQRKEIRRAVSAARLDLPGVSFDAYCLEVLRITAR